MNNNINNDEVNNNIKDQIDAYHEETNNFLKGYNNANKNIIVENPEKANINKINEFYRSQNVKVKIIESNPKYATAEVTFRNGRVITCTSRWGTLVECEKGITVGDDMIKCLEDINEYANSLHKSIKSIRFTQAIRTDLESCDIYRAEISFNDGVGAYYTREGEEFGFSHKAGTSIIEEMMPANYEEPNNNANPFGINNYDGENNNIINNEVNNNINNYNGANNNINNNEVNNNINNGEVNNNINNYNEMNNNINNDEVNNNINNIKDQIDAYHEETLRILNEIKGYNNANKNIIIENPEKANIIK